MPIYKTYNPNKFTSIKVWKILEDEYDHVRVYGKDYFKKLEKARLYVY